MHPLLLLVTIITSDGQVIVSDDYGRDAIKRQEQQSYKFDADGAVEVRGISGPVTVVAGADRTVSFVYERIAAKQQDYDCEVLKHEHSDKTLRIWVERKHDAGCRIIRAEDHLTVTVPKTASVELSSISDGVTVSGVEGLVKLKSIEDGARLDDVQQFEASAIGDFLQARVTRLGDAGIRVDSVGDRVVLDLAEAVNANLEVRGVGDSIRARDVSVIAPGRLEATLGKGGPMIRISGVGDIVDIRGGGKMHVIRSE